MTSDVVTELTVIVSNLLTISPHNLLTNLLTIKKHEKNTSKNKPCATGGAYGTDKTAGQGIEYY